MKSALSALLVLILVFSSATNSNANSPQLDISSVDISSTLVEAGRGAALAVLSDGSLLLGGGEQGDTLFHFHNQRLIELGKISQASERERDSRFGPTDIAVLKESAASVQLLISYPQLNPAKRCVRLVVFRFVLNLEKQSLAKKELWFQGKPCVPVGAVQHAAGRIAVIDSKRAYLTTGDLGFRKINNPAARGWLGGVFEVTAKKVKQISQGHRNPQGIVLVNQNLYISEHGPRGGDEINLIKPGKDYGWPFVTFGAPYGPGDYVKPTQTGVHKGYEPPLYQWTPSIAPTELVLLPSDTKWREFSNYLVMGSLAAQSLVFIELQKSDQIGKVHQVRVGERIRDLELMPNGSLVATTDGGALLFINLR